MTFSDAEKSATLAARRWKLRNFCGCLTESSFKQKTNSHDGLEVIVLFCSLFDKRSLLCQPITISSIHVDPAIWAALERFHLAEGRLGADSGLAEGTRKWGRKEDRPRRRRAPGIADMYQHQPLRTALSSTAFIFCLGIGSGPGAQDHDVTVGGWPLMASIMTELNIASAGTGFSITRVTGMGIATSTYLQRKPKMKKKCVMIGVDGRASPLGSLCFQSRAKKFLYDFQFYRNRNVTIPHVLDWNRLVMGQRNFHGLWDVTIDPMHYVA
eukprot:284816424_1